ncbi:MAG: nuclear transport factor 2 family protein [Gammaproteobacteria bacterium]|nr:nuclear transport factor 2 family protein [Gammaproteobacteria bacterium]RZV37385.1 MAG: nuclear transport factor 2 family protein [Acidimicrobiales bacterium]
MSAQDNKVIVEKMWQALSDMDWDAMMACMHPEIFYEDVPSDDPGAYGPENCVKRLKIAFEHLSKQEQETHSICANGDIVTLEHTEKWTFKTGETAAHRFCTVHEIKDSKVVRWSDYWDMNKFVGQFPGWFLEEMMKSTADDFTD